MSLRILSCKFTDYGWFSTEKFKLKKPACFPENERRDKKKRRGRGGKEGLMDRWKEGEREEGRGAGREKERVFYRQSCFLHV